MSRNRGSAARRPVVTISLFGLLCLAFLVGSVAPAVAVIP